MLGTVEPLSPPNTRQPLFATPSANKPVAVRDHPNGNKNKFYTNASRQTRQSTAETIIYMETILVSGMPLSSK